MRFFESPNYFGRFVLVAIIGGFVLQIVVPAALERAGAKTAALWSVLPGLLPILWATRGWFAGLTLIGSMLMWTINTVVYGAVLLLFLICCRRWRLWRAA